MKVLSGTATFAYAPEPDDGPVLGFQLRRSTLDQVPLHRGGRLRRKVVDESHGSGEGIFGDGDAARVPDAHDLLHGSSQERPRFGLSAHHTDRHAGDGPHLAERRDEQKLLPKLDPDVLGRLGMDAGGAQIVHKSLDPWAASAAPFPDDDVGLRAHFRRS